MHRYTSNMKRPSEKISLFWFIFAGCSQLEPWILIEAANHDRQHPNSCLLDQTLSSKWIVFKIFKEMGFEVSQSWKQSINLNFTIKKFDSDCSRKFHVCVGLNTPCGKLSL